jgi:RimJ/RimL family protein N-acetyltransferase
VSLRLGESPQLYYLGHIGYRVEEPFRGHGYAARAVAALRPVLLGLGLHTVVITTDVDNVPSRRTCERLGCVLERVAPVPPQYRALCMDSPAKCRYILFVQENQPGGTS